MSRDQAPRFLTRPAATDDIERLRDLAQAVATLPLLVRYGVDASRLAAALSGLAAAQSGPQRLLVAEAGDGQLVGFARVLLGGDDGGQFGRGGYLKLIALRPGHEGRGIGQMLLVAVEQTVAERFPDLFLLTSDFNHGAQRFYARAGYLRVGELPDFVHPGITEVIYWKRLRATS
jgi:ribosomal protein S18 acetylase RimI-like enzyme